MPTPQQGLSREVRALAFPAILHSLLQTLVFVVDRAMLGHHGETSLAAMQLAGAVEWSVVSVFAAFAVGTVARVGRHVGAKDHDRARLSAWVSIRFALASGLVLALASPLVVALLPRYAPETSPAVVEGAGEYLAVTLAASPFVFLGVTGTTTLQAGGDTRTPLLIGIFANVLHVGLNRLLILGGLGLAPMGTRGAAVSTSITFAVEASLALWVLSRPGRPVCLRRFEGKVFSRSETWMEARAVLKVATPAGLERLIYHGGYLGFVAMIARLGDVAMAANQVLIAVESICFLTADGFGIAAATLVAQKLGGGEERQAFRAARIACGYAVVTLVALGVGVLLLGRWLFPVFSNAPLVVALSLEVVPILAVAQPFLASGTVLAEAMRGAGLTAIALGVTAVGAFAVRLSCTYLFALRLGYGLVGVWMGSTVDWAARAVLLFAISAWLSRKRARSSLPSSDTARRI